MTKTVKDVPGRFVNHVSGLDTELRRGTLDYRLRLLEGIAGRDGSVLKASLEPLGALGRAAVGKSLGIHRAAGHALEAIVANRGCGLQA